MKRIVLSIVVLLVLLCGIAVAEEASIVASGECGDYLSKVTWTLDSEGTLTISGEGKMKDYSSWSNNVPWYAERTSIKTAVIEVGVTSIGNSAFRDCNKLSSITIPDGVTSIGSSAFSGCSSLSSITIPEGVTSIGNWAFEYCSSLTSIDLTAGVTSIGSGAFCECSSLDMIYVDSLEGWLNISFSGDSSNPLVYGGELYIAGELTTDLVLPAGLTSIGEYAFYNCSKLGSITIPEGVTSIGNCAFSFCSSLSSITIPEGMTSIGVWAFVSCSSLSSITIPDSVTSIGNSAFDSCSSLSSITLPAGLTSISDSAFEGCSSLSSITLPAGLTSISDSAFEGCSSLSSITIPESVTSIGDYAFKYCSSLRKVMFLGNDMPTLGGNVFSTSPTIYCYEFSDVDFWAVEKGYNCVYIDDMDLNTPISITLPQDMRIEMGENRTISAGLFPQTEKAEIVWQSSDPSVVSVENGVLTAHAIGEATITASCDGASDQMNITVYAPVEAFELSETELWVISKQYARLDIRDIQPAGATAFFTWESSDASVLTVSGGSIAALKPGDATVTVASDNGIARSCLVHVCYPVTAIALEQSEYQLSVGDEAQITAHVSTRDQSFVNRFVTFTSSNEAVVTVDSAGRIRVVAPGTATISVSATNGISAACSVTVVCAHSEATDTAVAPTCTESGLTEGSHCSICGEVLVAQEVVPAKGHSKVVDPAVAPTCTESGLTEGSHCSICGEVLVAQEIVPASHTPVTDPAVEPTCTETGLTEGSHCSICDEVLVAQKIVFASHTPVTDPVVPATHVTAGLTEGIHCSRCGETLVAQQVIPIVEVEKLVLPAELEIIEAEAFAGDGIVSVVIPEGCKVIGAGAFKDCDQLRFIEIPASVTEIDASAFDGCGEAMIIVTTSASTAEDFAAAHGFTCVTR